MSILDDLNNGLQYALCGFIGETIRFEDEKSGEINRFLRIRGLGGSYNLDLDSDEEMDRFKALLGSPTRAFGPLVRRRSSTAVKAKIDKLILPGDPNWKEPSEAEMLAKGKFVGWGMISEKKFSEWRGSTYRTLQISTFGDTFKFSDIDASLFETLPEAGLVQVTGILESKLTSTSSGQVNDLILVLEKIKIGDLGGGRPNVENSSKDPEKKTA